MKLTSIKLRWFSEKVFDTYIKILYHILLTTNRIKKKHKSYHSSNINILQFSHTNIKTKWNDKKHVLSCTYQNMSCITENYSSDLWNIYVLFSKRNYQNYNFE